MNWSQPGPGLQLSLCTSESRAIQCIRTDLNLETLLYICTYYFCTSFLPTHAMSCFECMLSNCKMNNDRADRYCSYGGLLLFDLSNNSQSVWSHFSIPGHLKLCLELHHWITFFLALHLSLQWFQMPQIHLNKIQNITRIVRLPLVIFDILR